VRVPSWFRNPWFLTGVVVLLVLVVSAQSVFATPQPINGIGPPYTRYNNFLIFRQSFAHLVANRDLYLAYPAEYGDFYKYSPAFALFMSPFTWLPDLPGVVLWNLLNALVLVVALWTMPAIAPERRPFLVAVVLVELVTSLQSQQSNALIAGLIILAFTQMEAGRAWAAALCIVLTVAIKLFGIVAFALLLLYPQRWRAAVASLAWLALFAVVPLLVVTPEQLGFLYRSWLHLLQADQSISYGLSVAGWLHAWFGVEWKPFVLAAGAALFGLPLLRRPMYRDQRFRALYLASCLLWMVIFNHKAESPTFVIAMAGVAIWYAIGEQSALDLGLLLLTLVVTELATTDVYPHAFKVAVIRPYALKAVPCILVWMKLVYDQWRRPRVRRERVPD
jgi:hypothetical protein